MSLPRSQLIGMAATVFKNADAKYAKYEEQIFILGQRIAAAEQAKEELRLGLNSALTGLEDWAKHSESLHPSGTPFEDQVRAGWHPRIVRARDLLQKYSPLNEIKTEPKP